MTRHLQVDPAIDDELLRYEEKLRRVKGEEYTEEARIHGIRVERPDQEPNEEYSEMLDLPLDEVEFRIALKTDSERRIMCVMEPPTSGWDLANDFVALLEYLELEPEELHTIDMESYTLPVFYNVGSEQYEVDFSAIRDTLFAENDE